MCGLLGYITKEPNRYLMDKKKFFKQALYADTFRGPDSTGICLIDNKNNPFVYKRALAGYDFVESGHFDKLLHRVDPKIAMGHNRAATRGSIHNSSAHPFQWGKIILAHNGTLTNHQSLEDGKNFTVDSEYIAYAFNKFGVEDTLKKIRGAFALTWFDTETKLFNVVRNSERELWYGTNETKSTFMYASEGQMMDWLSTRNNLPLDDSFFYEFEEKMWYTIDPDTLDMNQKEVEFAPAWNSTWQKKRTAQQNKSTNGNTRLPVITSTDTNSTTTSSVTHLAFKEALAELDLEMEEEIYLRFSHRTTTGIHVFKLGEWYPIDSSFEVQINDYKLSYEYVNKHRNAVYSATIRGCRKVTDTDKYIIYVNSTTSMEEGLNEKKSTEEQEQLLQGPKHKLITKAEWDKKTESGCDHCSGPISLDDAEYLRWSIHGTPICSDCCMSFYIDKDSKALTSILEP